MLDPMLNYLDKARQKPEADRKRLAVLWTIGLTVLVVGAWVINLVYFLPNPLGQETEVVAEAGPAKPSSATAGVATEPVGFAGQNLARIQNGWQVVVDKVTGLVK